jgi:hypothetical protein
MVLLRFPQDLTCPVVLGIPLGPFRISPTRLSRSMESLSMLFGYPSRSHIKVPRPRTTCVVRFRLFPFRSPLLRESNFFLFQRVLRCFTSPRLLYPGYVFTRESSVNRGGCPIRKSPDHRLLAAPRSLSQLSTSFIASHRQGIHHTPFVACHIPKARYDFLFSTRILNPGFDVSLPQLVKDLRAP